jgi:MFS family permease
MLMDISSEMIHALLPVYLVTTLGTTMMTVGFIEGIAEATAAITKIFSGALSDCLGKRNLLAASGYGLAAFTKPIFPLAPTVSWLIAARIIDRVGKGIRGAPRDSLQISPRFTCPAPASAYASHWTPWARLWVRCLASR